MNKMSDNFTLINGYKIPCVGFGTWQTPDGDTAVSSVKAAFMVMKKVLVQGLLKVRYHVKNFLLQVKYGIKIVAMRKP